MVSNYLYSATTVSTCCFLPLYFPPIRPWSIPQSTSDIHPRTYPTTLILILTAPVDRCTLEYSILWTPNGKKVLATENYWHIPTAFETAQKSLYSCQRTNKLQVYYCIKQIANGVLNYGVISALF